MTHFVIKSTREGFAPWWNNGPRWTEDATQALRFDSESAAGYIIACMRGANPDSFAWGHATVEAVETPAVKHAEVVKVKEAPSVLNKKPSERVKADKFQHLMKEGWRELRLAYIFLEDGARLSGATHLRTAADLFEQANTLRNEALGVSK